MPAEPRTAGEFFTSGECAIQECRSCGAVKSIDPDIVCMTFGDDFDMRVGARSLQNAFSCSSCGAPRPVIRFEDELQPDRTLMKPTAGQDEQLERRRA
jgi:hypothetical protein